MINIQVRQKTPNVASLNAHSAHDFNFKDAVNGSASCLWSHEYAIEFSIALLCDKEPRYIPSTRPHTPYKWIIARARGVVYPQVAVPRKKSPRRCEEVVYDSQVGTLISSVALPHSYGKHIISYKSPPLSHNQRDIFILFSQPVFCGSSTKSIILPVKFL